MITKESRKLDISEIVSMSEAIQVAAMGLLNGGDRRVDMACPKCGSLAVVELDFCCGVEASCSSCAFWMHVSMGLRFDEHGVDRRWPLKPYVLCNSVKLDVIPVATAVHGDLSMDIEGYTLSLFDKGQLYNVCKCSTIRELWETREYVISQYTNLIDQGYVFQGGQFVGEDRIPLSVESLTRY